MEYYKLYINGKWVDSSDGQTFVTQNPATGEEVNRFAQARSLRLLTAAERW